MPEAGGSGNVAPKIDTLRHWVVGGWFRAESSQDGGLSPASTMMIKSATQLKPSHNVNRKEKPNLGYLRLWVTVYGIYSRWTDSWWMMDLHRKMETCGREIKGRNRPSHLGLDVGVLGLVGP